MKRNCTYCNKEWIISTLQMDKDYECPHCFSKRKALRNGNSERASKNILQVNLNMGGRNKQDEI